MLKAGLITQSGGRLADWHSSVLTDLLESKSFNAVAVDVIVIFIIVVVIVVIIIDIAIKKRKAGSNSTSSTKLASDLELREAKEPDLSECLLGHKNISQTYFRVPPANAAKTYLEKCMELLTFCDMTSVEHSKQELNQKLIKGREARIEKLRELRKQMSEYDNKLASIMDKIGKAENDISAANDVTRRRQQHQPQEMNEFYERVKANPKLLLEMFPHEIRSAQQEKSQQNQEG